MSGNPLEQLIEESIQLELNVAALYELFSEVHEEDSDFWWQLHLEERSHATLLRTAKDSFVKKGQFPVDLVASSISNLIDANTRVREKIEQCKDQSVAREEACLIAIELEKSAGENHYALFMERAPNNPIESVFHQLNREDLHHEERIEHYLNTHVKLSTHAAS